MDVKSNIRYVHAYDFDIKMGRTEKTNAHNNIQILFHWNIRIYREGGTL